MGKTENITQLEISIYNFKYPPYLKKKTNKTKYKI